ncbi:GntR family transcriptional regulator [Kocuria nitroreducens]|uniref:GntR family transcriptional regulator n=1 Tax=Kocuria nitroreducens TaxID=3058914 RepID=UPI0036DC6A06
MMIKNEPLGDQLARELRRGILSGTRQPGELLIEKTLSEEYGLSRGPVRDAFQQLKQEGLIEPVGRSYRVCAVMAEDIMEFVDVRMALEMLAVERAMGRNPDWSAARDAVAAMHAAADVNDPKAFAYADLAFHTALIEATPQRRLNETYRTLRRTLETLLEMNPELLEDDAVSTANEHEELLNAIETGDKRWRHLLRQQLYAGLQLLLNRFGEQWGRNDAN